MGVKVTNAEWHRRRDAQRLMNYHKAMRAAEVDAAPTPPVTMNINGLGERQIVRGLGPGHIIAIDEASELTPQFLNEFAREFMENHLNLDFAGMMAGDAVRLGVDPAGEPEGRRVTAREIRDRQNSAPPLNQRSRVAPPVYFNRWFDLTDSENELQSFLWLCYRVAERDRREGAMSVKEMEGDADG